MHRRYSDFFVYEFFVVRSFCIPCDIWYSDTWSQQAYVSSIHPILLYLLATSMYNKGDKEMEDKQRILDNFE